MSAENSRAILAILQKNTAEGHLPYYDQLTWTTQDPGTRPPHTADERLLIGHDNEDGSATFAHYLTSGTNKKVIAYYKDGSLKELYRHALRVAVLEVPFHNLMKLDLADDTRFSLTGSYIKAAFTLKGLTDGAPFELTAGFQAGLKRVLDILARKENREHSERGSGSSKSRKSSSSDSSVLSSNASVVPAGAAMVSNNTHHPKSRAREVSSSSSSQASEDNTLDPANDSLDDFPKRDFGHTPSNSSNNKHYGLFSPAKPRQQTQTSTPIRSSLYRHGAESSSHKPKSLGMFSSMGSTKRVSTETSDQITGAENTPRKETIDRLDVEDSDSLFVPHLSRNRELESPTSQINSSPLSLGPGSISRSTAEEYDGVRQAPSAAEEVLNEDPGSEDRLARNAEKFLKLEALIKQGILKIETFEGQIDGYEQKEAAIHNEVQARELEENSTRDEILARAEKRKDKFRKTMEGELAAIDRETEDVVTRATESIRKTKAKIAEQTIQLEGLKQMEMVKLKEERDAVAKNKKELQELKEIGGFDLGLAVMAKKAQHP